jgi:hypothetical protein
VVELTQITKAVAEALGLATAFVKLGTAVKERPPTDTPDSEKDQASRGRVRQELATLRSQTISVCREMTEKIQLLFETSQSFGLSQSITISQQLDELRWYNFSTRSRLKGFREASNAARRQLTSIIDDATAMLICNDQQGLAAVAFKECEALQKQLNDLMFDPTVTIGRQLKIMIDTAREVSAKLEMQV